MNAYSLPSRWMLFIGALLAFLVIGAAIAAACTIYWGTNTIENISTGSGEYTVVGDPTAGMDRCDGAGSGSHFSASNDDQDTVRVEIDEYVGSHCEDSSYETNSLADGDALDADGDGVPDEPVYVNTYEDDAYENSSLLGVDPDVYEDNDLLSYDSQEPGGGESDERVGDCMGDGDSDGDGHPDSQGPVINKYAGPDDDGDGHGDGIAVNSSGQFASGETNNGSDDVDGDGVNDVDITIDTASDSSTDHASAVCVSDGDGGDSAPQIPLVIS